MSKVLNKFILSILFSFGFSSGLFANVNTTQNNTSELFDSLNQKETEFVFSKDEQKELINLLKFIKAKRSENKEDSSFKVESLKAKTLNKLLKSTSVLRSKVYYVAPIIGGAVIGALIAGPGLMVFWDYGCSGKAFALKCFPPFDKLFGETCSCPGASDLNVVSNFVSSPLGSYAVAEGLKKGGAWCIGNGKAIVVGFASAQGSKIFKSWIHSIRRKTGH